MAVSYKKLFKIRLIDRDMKKKESKSIDGD